MYDDYGYEEPEEREPDEADRALGRFLDLIFGTAGGSAGFDPGSGHFTDPELDQLAGRFDPEGDLPSQLGAAAAFLRRHRCRVFMRRWRRNRPVPPQQDRDRFAVAVLLARLLALRAVAQITAARDDQAAAPAPGAGEESARILLAAPCAPPAPVIASAGMTG